MGAVISLVFADAALTDVRFEDIGNYGIVAGGVGLLGFISGDIEIAVPGEVVAAYLYWAGYDTSPGGDDEVDFDGVTVTADIVYGPDFWLDNDPDEYHYVYVEDVTSHVDTGSDTYTVAEVEFDKNYGAGLIVVYEDELLPLAKVTILDGLDSFWFDFSDPRGPNSEVLCLEFDKARYDRDAEMFLLVGGTEHPDRPNTLWTDTGKGAVPDDIITSPSSSNGPYPLGGYDGGAWDTYIDTVVIPEGDDWLCVQVESIPEYEAEYPPDTPPYNGRGNSGVLVAAGFVLPLPMGNGKVTGGGQIVIPEGKGSFGFNAMWFSRDPAPKGELEWVDHDTGMKVHVHLLDYLEVWEELVGNKPWPLQKAFFSGPCTVDHQDGFRFEVYVEDNGEPGKQDYFEISVYNNGGLYYHAGDDLLHGNVQIHKPPK